MERERTALLSVLRPEREDAEKRSQSERGAIVRNYTRPHTETKAKRAKRFNLFPFCDHVLDRDYPFRETWIIWTIGLIYSLPQKSDYFGYPEFGQVSD